MPVPAHVRITVFDVGGRRVRTLEDRDLPAGDHAVAWDGTDSVHRPVASGVYFYQVKIGDFSVRRRMVLVR
jgi:flagellar hook assembly protein FlgD